MDIFDYKFIYLFAFCLTYDYSDIEVYPVPLHFFIRTSKIFDESECSFFEDFQFQNVLLFFTKNGYLLTTKITLDVYNCLLFLYAMQELGDSLCMLDAPFGV